MMQFNIKQWTATSPGLVTQSDWLEWAKTSMQWPKEAEKLPVDLIPAMMRRRMSTLSKLAIQTALSLSQLHPIDYIVFASRHGELTRTVSLLEDILQAEDASPMAFSQSVHNTASGLFTIISRLTTSVSSIAACEETFHAAIIDALAYLNQNPTHNVLVINFDEPLPNQYAQFETDDYQGFALGFLIESGEQYTVERVGKQPLDENIIGGPTNARPDGLLFMQDMLNASEQWVIERPRADYHWHQLSQSS